MTKGIILIDIPKYCHDCDCLSGEHWCGMTGKSIYNGEASKYCPIKPLPTTYFTSAYTKGDRYEDGWNDCIKEILGE